MLDFITLDAVAAMVTVVGIDLAMSADNAIVIGLAAATLPAAMRGKAIIWGTVAAAILRIGLALIAVKLLNVLGLMLAGGVLLLYVAWRLWWELRGPHTAELMEESHKVLGDEPDIALRRAVYRIVLADLSMSIENILGVAGAARNHLVILVIGLTLSILLTGAAAAVVAKIMERYRWVGIAGVVMIVAVSLQMIWEGGQAVWTHFFGG